MLPGIDNRVRRLRVTHGLRSVQTNSTTHPALTWDATSSPPRSAAQPATSSSNVVRIELVVTIHMAWIDSPESEQARKVAGRRLEQLEGDMSERELASCHNYYMNSLVWMSEEKRAEYDRLKHEQEEIHKKRTRPRGRARASSARRAKTRRSVLLAQGTALNN